MKHIKSLLLFIGACFVSSTHADVNTYFNKIKNDHQALYQFFKNMPKGGELHYHLAGGPNPEKMLSLVAQDDYCLNTDSLAISKTTSCDGVKTKDIFSDTTLYSKIIKSWSMQDFIPGEESGHDHFFNGFEKYLTIVFDYRPQLIADVIQRAAEQHEHYLELMDIPDNANSLGFGELIKTISSYAKKRQLLLANQDFQHNIQHTIDESEHMLQAARQGLGCDVNPKSAACQVKIKFLYYTLREQPLNNVFAQTLNAFESVSRSRGTLVGVNLVQPEDGAISLRDYHEQMLIFNYFHEIYPNVPISLHAGELSPSSSTPEELTNHIQEAVLTGHAQRIGHGVDITHETHASETVKYMAQYHVPVEINLISNLKILNISGDNHPLNYYLDHQVPVVLSTDDEGILRTDLSQQYVEAVQTHHLTYPALKQINRNALTYAFLPGKSIWQNTNKTKMVNQCHDLNSSSCLQFIKKSEKAQLQWDLEQQLIAFEGSIS
jgi:adenosine deaminase